MGSKRNKKNHRNNHRHVFKKGRSLLSRKRTQQGLKNQTSVPSEVTNEPVTIEGCRIMNLDTLKQYTDELSLQSSSCEGSIVLKGETRFGLASILTWQCSKCTRNITLESSPKVNGPNKYTKWECNLAAVRGQMTTGSGHSHLEESMGVSVMTKPSFISTERSIVEWWKEKLMESMC